MADRAGSANNKNKAGKGEKLGHWERENKRVANYFVILYKQRKWRKTLYNNKTNRYLSFLISLELYCNLKFNPLNAKYVNIRKHPEEGRLVFSRPANSAADFGGFLTGLWSPRPSFPGRPCNGSSQPGSRAHCSTVRNVGHCCSNWSRPGSGSGSASPLPSWPSSSCLSSLSAHSSLKY